MSNIDNSARDRRIHESLMERARWRMQPMSERQRIEELFKFLLRHQRTAKHGEYVVLNSDRSDAEVNEVLKTIGEVITVDFEETFGFTAPWKLLAQKL